jgi:signal transduction histidine kinase/CHASE3 domain sensor protein
MPTSTTDTIPLAQHRPARERPRSWLTWLPLALVLFSIVSLLAVPRVMNRKIETQRQRVVSYVIPARTLLGRIQLDLATQMAAARGHLLTQDPRFRREFEVASAKEEQHFQQLKPLAQAIGPEVLEIETRLHAAKIAWTDLLPDAPPGRRTTRQSHEGLDRNSLFQDIVHRASQLDDALATREREAREEVERLMELQDLLVTGLALLALGSAAAVAWLAVRSQQLGEVLARRVKQERALREVARSVSGALTADAVAQQVVRHAVESTRASAGYLERVEDGQVRVVATAGAGAPERGAVAPFPGSLVPSMVGGDDAHVGVGVGEIGSAMAPLLQPTYVDCPTLLVPLRDDGQVLGALVLLRGAGRHEFDDEDVPQARALGDLASAALRRVVLSEERDRQRRAAENAVRARDEVLAIVSHDLRNPLNAIVMGAQALISMNLPRDQQEPMLQIIRRNANRMDRLIQDLLDASRIQGGRQLRMEPAPLALLPVVEEVCQGVGVRTKSTLQTVTCQVPAALPLVTADRDRLIQVMGNLVDNALRFTPEGGTVAVRARLLGAFVRIEVADTGPGIPERHVAHLFEPFYQARQAGRNTTGLGLAIAKGIVEAHGGAIGVDTAEARGSTFWFTLPVASPDPDPDPEKEPVAAAAEA